jgi:Zn-dependent protease
MEPLKPYNYVEPTRPDPPETAPRPAGAAQSPAVTPHAPGSAAHAPASGPEPLSGGPEQPAQRRRWHRGGATGIGAAVLAFAAKAKVVLLALGHVKLLVTVGSMVISIAAYASIWGLPFALGFVALLFVHEMGHVIAIKFEGGKASWPFFIPFMGAMIAARSFGDDAAAEARVGLAGPVLGTVGSAVCFFIWKDTGHQIWQGLAYFGFFLNLFNLIPVLPLDGGRAMSAMSPVMWIVGYLVLVGVVVSVALSPIFGIFLILGAFETVKRWRAWRSGEAGAYYQVNPTDRIAIAVTYVVLVAVLALGMHATYFHASFV